MTPAQKHMGNVAKLGCIVCRLLGLGETPAQVHHIREGRITRNDFLVLPLCLSHHVGSSQSMHLNKTALLLSLGVLSEFDLLARVTQLLYEEGTYK